MTRRRSRPLNADEQRLWRRVAATATPLRPEPRGEPHIPSPEIPPPARPMETIAPFSLGQAGNEGTRPPPAPKPAFQLDARLHGRMRRGKLRPEGRIDLHGMRLDEAHAALQCFVMRAHGRGQRLLLVITGKGSTSDGPVFERRGVLRHQVPHWLTAPPLATLVQEVVPAHRSHGGEGALYVYLRRSPRPGA